MTETMRPLRLDLMQADRRNIWPLPSGEMAVRPGLRVLKSSGDAIVWARSMPNPINGAVRHLVITMDATTEALTLRAWDETFAEEWTYDLDAVGKPRAVSLCNIATDVFLTSPDFDSLHWVVGGYPARDTPTTSITGRTSLPIPRGISVSWAGRRVMAEENRLYVSDALDGRAFISDNVQIGEWLGEVRGLFVGESGALLVVGGDGVYLWPEAVAASGGIPLGQWSKVADYVTRDYSDTLQHRGSVWGLTRAGLRRLVPEDPRSLPLSERVGARSIGARVHCEDWRRASAISSDLALMVAYGDKTWLASDATVSWWDIATGLCVVGVLEDAIGDTLLVTDGKVYALSGNKDGDTTVTAEDARPFGVVTAKAPLGLSGQTAYRELRWRTDTDAAAGAKTAVNGATPKTSTTIKRAPVVGTATWTGSDALIPAEMSVVEDGWKAWGSEVTIELAAQGCQTRIDPVAEIDVIKSSRDGGR